MARFIEKVGLSFDDILLVPRKSSIKSRFDGEINLAAQILPGIELKYPMISANMDTVSGLNLVNRMNELGGTGIIHRFMSVEDHKNCLKKVNKVRIGCIGVGENGQARMKEIAEFCDAVLVDVAHGHSDAVIQQIEWLKKHFDIPIIAGNVATMNGAYDLATAGADCIKVGVGPGCFGAGTRVLMASGFYKNIEDIKVGDYVISSSGKPTKVVAQRNTGIRKVMRVRHTQNAKGSICTPDHNFWCGDLNTISQSTLSNSGYAVHLDKQAKTTPKESKYKWKEIQDFRRDVALMPKNISFSLPEIFEKRLEHKTEGSFFLYPSYDVGYLFGFFLGDGHSCCTVNKKNGSHSGRVSFYPSLDQKHIVEKLDNICFSLFKRNLDINEVKGCYDLKLFFKPFADFLVAFGKKDEKHLPEEFLVSNKEYLTGLLDGLQDSDGINSDRIGFKNTSKKLVELYFVLTYILTGVFPTLEFSPASIGGLDCNIENCKDSILSRKCPSYEKRQTKEYQVIKILEINELELEIPVYDIEVECDSHSFIADNAIVHNSHCTTRLKTGNGVPQATAIIECLEGIDHWYVDNSSSKRTISLIADGGIKDSGDVVKALALGADAVMIGSIFAGVEEAPGKPIQGPNGLVKQYRGMASRAVQEDWKGSATSVEGEMSMVPYKGGLENIFNDLLSGMLSGMSYQDAKNITQLKENAVFIRQTSAGIQESKPHGLLR